MDMTKQVVSASKAYAEASGLSLSTISNQLAGYGSFLKNLEKGCGMTTRTYEKADVYFAERGIDLRSFGQC